MRRSFLSSLLLPLVFAGACVDAPRERDGGLSDTSAELIDPATPWAMHTISNAFAGADGHALGDTDGDGDPDLIVIGWEERSKVSTHSRPADPKTPWPLLASYAHSSVEDVLFCDVDLNGTLDVFSFGEDKKIRAAKNLGATFAAPIVLTAASGVEQWTQGACGPVVAGKREIYAGGRVASGTNTLGIYLLTSATPWTAATWTKSLVVAAGWTMLLDVSQDVDGDGTRDLFYTDRLQAAPTVNGVRYATKASGAWASVVVAPVVDGYLPRFGHRLAEGTLLWGGVKESNQTSRLWLDAAALPYPAGIGPYQAGALADLDGDGDLDVAVTTGQVGAHVQLTTWPGVFMLLNDGAGGWTFAAGSGPTGGKWDEIDPTDMDGDGDLDLVTTEQWLGLGGVWLENPSWP